MKYLISNGASIDNTYAHVQQDEHEIEKVYAAQDKTFDICTLARTPLQIACVKGYLDIVKFLLDVHVDLDVVGYAGVTALHLAVLAV